MDPSANSHELGTMNHQEEGIPRTLSFHLGSEDTAAAHGGQEDGSMTLQRETDPVMGLEDALPESQMVVVIVTPTPVGTECGQSCRAQITPLRNQGQTKGQSCFPKTLDTSFRLSISLLTRHKTVYLISSTD